MQASDALGSPRWWQWPTILSLDAPAVALVWQEEFARVGLVSIAWYHRFLLGLTVWLIYVADRWVEGLWQDAGKIRTPRHRFYVRYRWPIAALAAFAGIVLGGGVALTCLNSREWLAGGAIALAVAVYLLSHQYLHRNHPWRAPKEACIGILFAMGCALAAGLQTHAHEAALAGMAALFGLLCFINCALISLWEEAIDRARGQTSFALQFAPNHRLIHQLAWLGVGMGSFVALGPVVPTMREGAMCIAASSALLACVDYAQPRIGWQAARVLADAVLLTPLLAWFFPRLPH